MQQSNCDPISSSISTVLGIEACPKCGAEMEPIDIAVEGLSARDLKLCPACYLVTWVDETGFQSRQGVPVKPEVGN